jgi:hypothetical protein
MCLIRSSFTSRASSWSGWQQVEGKYVSYSWPRTHPHSILFPGTNRAFHALDTDGSVHVWGKDAYICCFIPP